MRVLVAAAALTLVPALSTPQSLGEVASRQARQRSSGEHSAKVYTDADLLATEPVTVPVPASTANTNPAASAERRARVAPGDTALPRSLAGAPASLVDPVRAQLDREETDRRQRESYWRQLAAATRQRVEATQRAYDETCGRGLIVPTGG
ncbi:MAG TPA: hypothetical protein VMX54_21360 [Vicinamibacteria bacterium]|nr:hypothetical protein [Vicinamibacteria bacterium]